MTKNSTNIKYINDKAITCVLKNPLPLKEQLKQILNIIIIQFNSLFIYVTIIIGTYIKEGKLRVDLQLNELLDQDLEPRRLQQ
jgi:hypothetical protein